MMELPLYQSLDEVRADALNCRACGRARTRRQVVFGAGDPDAKIMIVGEAPSATDDDTGLPYTGPAGDYLDELLAEAGTSRDAIWITNLLRCFEGRRRGGRIENQPARLAEIRACSRWLNLEIQYVAPKAIIAMGSPAAHALISQSSSSPSSEERSSNARMVFRLCQRPSPPTRCVSRVSSTPQRRSVNARRYLRTCPSPSR